MKTWILKQYNLGMWPGAIRDMYGRATFDASPIQYFMMAATTYVVTAKDYIHQYIPWFSFGMFLVLFILIIWLLMLLDWKFLTPSSIRLSNALGYAHGSPIETDFIEVKRELSEIKALLRNIKEIRDTEIGQNDMF